jgi:protein TonB
MSVSTSSAAIFSPSAQNRALALCVLVSLALHALALLLPGLRAGAPAPAVPRMITATFTPRAAAPEPQPAVTESRLRDEPEPVSPKTEARPQRETPRPVLATPAPAGPRAPDVPAAPAPAAESAPPAAAASGATAPRPAEAQAAAASPGTGTTRAASDADTGTLAQYRLALIGVARRYKRYPAQAMDKGWQGKVEIRLVVGANGMIQSSLVKASSGHEILDNQALDMVKKAKPLTPIPAALRGREFTVDIPVIFDLQSG